MASVVQGHGVYGPYVATTTKVHASSASGSAALGFGTAEVSAGHDGPVSFASTVSIGPTGHRNDATAGSSATGSATAVVSVAGNASPRAASEGPSEAVLIVGLGVAQATGLVTSLVTDAGTEVPAGNATVTGGRTIDVGP